MKCFLRVSLLSLMMVALFASSVFAGVCPDCQTESPGDTCLDCGQTLDKVVLSTSSDFAGVCPDCQTESPGDTCLDCGRVLGKMPSDASTEQNLVGFDMSVNEIQEHIANVMTPEKDIEYFAAYGMVFPVDFDHNAIVNFGNALLNSEMGEYELPAGMAGMWDIQLIYSSNDHVRFVGEIDQIPIHTEKKPLYIGLIRDGVRYDLYYSSGVLGAWCYVNICRSSINIDHDDSIRVPHVRWSIYLSDPVSATVDQVMFSVLPDGNTEESSSFDMYWYERIGDSEE